MSIRIAKPNAGEKITVSIPEESAGQAAAIGFATAGVNVERAGNDLVFQFEDGSETRVTDFFVTSGKALPDFVLEDGTTVSSADVLKQLNENIDLETAAGPGSAASNSSGGSGEYADDAGSLIDGVGRLSAIDGLGQWAYSATGGDVATSSLDTLPPNEEVFAPGNALNNGAPIISTLSAGLINEDQFVFADSDTWNGGGTITMGTVSASDPDSDPLTYSITGGNRASITLEGNAYEIGTYTIDSSSGEITLTLDATITGAHGKTPAEIIVMINALKGGSVETSAALSQITVAVSDGVSSVTKTVDFNDVTGVNDRPVVADVIETMTEGGSVNGDLATNGFVSDADSTAHTFEAVSITYKGVAVSAADAGLTINSDGTWTIDGTRILYKSLGLGDTADLVITYTATDDSNSSTAASAPKTITVTVTGTEGGPDFVGSDFTLHEPGLVPGWGGSQSAEDIAESLSAVKQELDLEFTHDDGNYPLSVTISIGNDSITFDRLGDGTISFGSGAPTTITTTYGQLSYENGKFYYTVLNEADKLHSTDNTDSFFVSITDTQGRTLTDSFDITIEAKNDAPVFFGNDQYGTGYDPSQPLVLTPFIDSTKVVRGQLRVGDVDSTDADLGFVIVDAGTAYTGSSGSVVIDVNGVQTTYSGFTFDLPHGTVVIYWDATATNGSFPSDTPGAWSYQYTLKDEYIQNNKLSNVEIDMQIVVCDPLFDPTTYDPNNPHELTNTADLHVEASLFGVEGHTAVTPDFVTVDETGAISFNGKVLNNGDELNVMGNDLDSRGNPADAPNAKTEIVNAGGVPLNKFDSGKGMNYAEGETEYGTWKLYEDGTFEFDVDVTAPAFIALGKESAVITIPYSVTDFQDAQSQAQTATSYIKVTVQGNNDAPDLVDSKLSIVAGWGDNDGVLSFTADAIAKDVDTGDTLHFTFTDGSGAALVPVPQGQAVFDPDDFNLPPGYTFDPNGDLPEGQQYTQTVGNGVDDQVYDYGVGWLVVHTDGTYEFVVNKVHPDVIKLKPGETLDVTINYDVADRASHETGGNTVTGGKLVIAIEGCYDKLAVGDLSGQLSSGFFKQEDYDGDGKLEAVYRYGYQNKTTFGPNGEPIAIDGVSDPISELPNHSWSQPLFTLNNTNLAMQLDGDPMRYTLSLNTGTGYHTVWGMNPDGTFTELGMMAVINNVQLSWLPLDEHGGMSTLNGVYDKFYTDISDPNNPVALQVYVASSDSPNTKTPVDLDVVLEFVNDSPTITGLRVEVVANTAVGQVEFYDVDSKAEDLTLWVADNDGNLVKIDANGTVVNYDHGTLTVNTDGSFSYQKTDPSDTGNHNIKVVVDDGESASQNYIAIANGSANQLASIVDDAFKLQFSWDNKQWKVGNVLTNDGGYDLTAGVLNAGMYNITNMVIREEGATGDSVIGGTPWGSAGDAPALLTIAGGSRFDEIKFSEGAFTINTDGSIHMNTLKSAYMVFHDSGTGKTFQIGMETAGVAFDTILAEINEGVNPGDPGYMTMDELKSSLNFQVEYQVRDEGTGEMVTGTVTLNVGEGYSHNTTYRANDSFANQLTTGSAMNTTENGIMKIGAQTVYLNRDNDGEDTWFRVNTYDINGNKTEGTLENVRDFTDGHREVQGGNVVYNGTDTVTVPMYSWINTATGEVSNIRGTGADWYCIEVGTAEAKFTVLGPSVLIGYEADGTTPIFGESCANVRAIFTRDFTSLNDLDSSAPDYAIKYAALKAFYEHIRAMTEGEEGRFVFLELETGDINAAGTDFKSSVGGNSSWTFTITGTDVAVTDKIYEFDEHELVNNQSVTTAAGTDSTNTWDASRHNINGWDDSATTQKVDGEFGYLQWDSAAHTYKYHLYQVGDTKGGVVLNQAAIDLLEKQIAQMVNGESKTESFDVIMVDKNGESKAGTITVKVNGEDSDFTPDLSGILNTVAEHQLFSNDLASAFGIEDAGTIRYHLKINGITYPLASQTGDTVEVTVHTAGGDNMGKIVFYPATGQYYFVANGVLENGQTETINIEAWATVENPNHSGYINGTSGPHGYTTPPVNVDLGVSGINDAPVVYTISGTVSTEGFIEGGIGWTDIDHATNSPVTVAYENSQGQQASAYNDGTTAYDYTLAGDYGTLLYDSETGTYRYTLDESSLIGYDRILDVFDVQVTDAGHLGGDNATGHNDLVIYGVNGSDVRGTVGNDQIGGSGGINLEAGKSHIIRGGAGDDLIDLSGTSGENILVWKSGDEARDGSTAIDTILGFNLENDLFDGDALDLRNMLESILGTTGKTAKDVISYEVNNGDTTINIVSAEDSSQIVQQIVLENVALTASDTANGTYAELANQILLLTQ